MDKPKKSLAIGCLTFGIIAIALFTFFIVTSDSEPSAKELAQAETIINAFNEKTPSYIEATNGVVKRVNMSMVKGAESYRVDVYIAEKSWATATESEKSSVAATINNQMRKLAEPTKVYVTLLSYENGDELAKLNLANDGYKIVR